MIRPPPYKAGAASGVTNAYCTVMGVVPTVLENAGLKHPGTHYKGREIARLRGKSWVPLLDAVSSRAPSTGDEYLLIHGEQYITGFEIGGSGALRGIGKLSLSPLPGVPRNGSSSTSRRIPARQGIIETLSPANSTR